MTREVAFQVIMTEVCSILFFFFFWRNKHTQGRCALSVDEDEQIPQPFQYELSIFFLFVDK